MAELISCITKTGIFFLWAFSLSSLVVDVISWIGDIHQTPELHSLLTRHKVSSQAAKVGAIQQNQ